MELSLRALGQGCGVAGADGPTAHPDLLPPALQPPSPLMSHLHEEG